MVENFNSKKLRIMMIDDDYAAHKYHKIMMEEAGYESETVSVQECYSVDEALEQLRTVDSISSPSIILVDLNMPRKNGWDFLEELSQIKFNENRPQVFVVSNSENPNDIAKSKSYTDVIGFRTKFLNTEFFKELLSNPTSEN